MNTANGAEGSIAQRFPHLAPDDDLLKIVAWCEALEGKVDNFGNRLDIWTTAILKQTDLATQQNNLIVSQNLELQATAKKYEAFGKTLLQLKADLDLLKTEFAELKKQIGLQTTTLSGLKRSIETVESKLNQFKQNLESKITTLSTKSTESFNHLNAKADHTAQTSNTNQWLIILFCGSLVAMQAFTIWNLHGIRQRAEWAMTKLERLEKRQ